MVQMYVFTFNISRQTSFDEIYCLWSL